MFLSFSDLFVSIEQQKPRFSLRKRVTVQVPLSLRMNKRTAELTDWQTRKTVSQRRIDQIKILFHYNLQAILLLSLSELAGS